MYRNTCRTNRTIRWFSFLAGLSFLFFTAQSRSQSQSPPSQITIILVEGNVEILRANPAAAPSWEPASPNSILNPGDRVRTGERSQVALRLADQSILRFSEKSDFTYELPQPSTPAAPAAVAKPRVRFNILQGLLHFFHRESPSDIEIETRAVSAAVRGTEFTVEVQPDGTTFLALIDGAVEFKNEFGSLDLKTSDQAIAQPGRAPELRPRIDAINIIQWTLYYPGILDPAELGLNLTPQDKALTTSLDAYRSGDLLQAVNAYPATTAATTAQTRSPEHSLYLAALLLSVGQVDHATQLLSPALQQPPDTRSHRLARALQKLIAAVKFQTVPQSDPSLGTNSSLTSELATELLADSYYQQSRGNLTTALYAARRAATASPNFGFAWARVAELEFSHGRIHTASAALDIALRLSPRNAQAVALKGFLLAAQNKIPAASAQFDQAIQIDPTLANAWLGRGLTKIRQGQREAGRQDLLAAAALEPNRAALRSYLGKAYATVGDRPQALAELDRAKTLDPGDPTAWLYSALLHHEYNQVNQAIRDLEHSQTLNTNRALYRSQFLLDQDRAVRSANLARIYDDAGMNEWSVQEAGRAVAADYANYSAHLFLADSYAELRDPNLVNLRYESPQVAEYLTANLLAPVGAGLLSPTISQNEYSKLFHENGFGLVSSTEYFSRGAWTQSGAQYGVFGNFAYNLEGFYQSDPGYRPNNDIETRYLSLQLKQQLTSQDTVFAQIGYLDLEAGDVYQYYHADQADPDYRVSETQEPILSFGYHREWNPQSHTLLFATRVPDEINLTDDNRSSLFMFAPEGPIIQLDSFSFGEASYRSDNAIYSMELQHILDIENHRIIAGGRIQYGDLDVLNTTRFPNNYEGFFGDFGAPITTSADYTFNRQTAYLYYTWRIAEPFSFFSGLAFDHISYPVNFLDVAVTEDNESATHLSPKVGMIYQPFDRTTIRAAYAQSIGGGNFDQSLRIEPTQIAGFNQTFRSVAPESFVGGIPGETFETYGVALEQKFKTETYLNVRADRLTSSGSRSRGVFMPAIVFVDEFEVFSHTAVNLREDIEFAETSATVSLSQLLGRHFALSLFYRLADVDYDKAFPEIPSDPEVLSSEKRFESGEGMLHTFRAATHFNHHSGLFSTIDAVFTAQNTHGFESEPGADDEAFWQFNAVAGYRFWNRRAELTAGVLNITNEDYNLVSINLYNELPRERTFYLRFRWSL